MTEFKITITRKHLYALVAVIVTIAVAIPVGSWAGDRFTDVPDSNIFHDDITWLAETGVTRGCNPPDNTEFCPEGNVTRQQLSAFMRRFAAHLESDGRVLAATSATYAALADQAGDASTLGGLAPGELGTATYRVEAAKDPGPSIDALWAHCDAGDPVTGGGAVNLTYVGAMWPFDAAQDPDASDLAGYYAEWNFSLAGGPGSGWMGVYAMCLDLPPLRPSS